MCGYKDWRVWMNIVRTESVLCTLPQLFALAKVTFMNRTRICLLFSILSSLCRVKERRTLVVLTIDKVQSTHSASNVSLANWIFFSSLVLG